MSHRAVKIWVRLGLLIGLSVSAAAVTENVVRRSSTGELQTLDPQLWTYGQDGNIAQDLFQGLTTLDAKANVVAGQAESWTISPDGRTYTFRLRSNLQWSDGKGITSADFLWSLRRIFDPQTVSPAVALLYVIRNGKAVNQGKLPVAALGVQAPDP
ncbi:MAG: peptide ABC transporter substrate-binding protein, partial [Gammaproteobacteria bacterium]|nr:peptide ABC transporter substrate-binding protein [Gammaproteobacteria bacterium]